MLQSTEGGSWQRHSGRPAETPAPRREGSVGSPPSPEMRHHIHLPSQMCSGGLGCSRGPGGHVCVPHLACLSVSQATSIHPCGAGVRPGDSVLRAASLPGFLLSPVGSWPFQPAGFKPVLPVGPEAARDPGPRPGKRPLHLSA